MDRSKSHHTKFRYMTPVFGVLLIDKTTLGSQPALEDHQQRFRQLQSPDHLVA